jgi:hypothetical protein
MENLRLLKEIESFLIMFNKKKSTEMGKTIVYLLEIFSISNYINKLDAITSLLSTIPKMKELTDGILEVDRIIYNQTIRYTILIINNNWKKYIDGEENILVLLNLLKKMIIDNIYGKMIFNKICEIILNENKENYVLLKKINEKSELLTIKYEKIDYNISTLFNNISMYKEIEDKPIIKQNTNIEDEYVNILDNLYKTDAISMIIIDDEAQGFNKLIEKLKTSSSISIKMRE